MVGLNSKLDTDEGSSDGLEDKSEELMEGITEIKGWKVQKGDYKTWKTK